MLPETAKRLVELIGFEATMAMVKRWGGLKLTIPKGHSRRDGGFTEALEALIGAEKTRILMAAFGGDELYVPNCAALVRNARDLQVIDDLRTMTVVAVALKHQMSERNVQYIGKKCPVAMDGYNFIGMRRDERQIDLF